MTKKEFNKIWKDSTKEQILNSYYYDYEEMINYHIIIKEVREYIIKNYPVCACSEILEILDKLFYN